MTEYLRAIRVDHPEVDDPAEPGSPLRFKASTEGVKRDGLDLKSDDWTFENVRANPTFLWSHGFTSQPSIGKFEIALDGTDTMIDVTFDQNDDFARMIENKYRNGFLNAVSMGWINVEVEEDGKRRQLRDVTEVSAVNVPADPDALIERQVEVIREEALELTRILKTWDERHELDLDDPPENTDDDPPASYGRPGGLGATWRGVRMSNDDNEAFATGITPPHNRGIYEGSKKNTLGVDDIDFVYSRFDEGLSIFLGFLPHHAATGEAIVSYVIESMARLYIGIAGIPDADHKGAYDHLARHYRQAKITPPEYIDPARLRVFDRDQTANLFAGDQRAIVLDLPVDPDMLTDSDMGRLVELSDELRAILSGRRVATPPESQPELADQLATLDGILDKLKPKEVKDNE